MTVDQKTLESFDLETFGFSRDIFDSIQFENYVDSIGEDALKVTLVIKDSVSLEAIAKDSLAWKEKIHDTLAERGVEQFPYVFLAQESDLLDTEEEMG